MIEHAAGEKFKTKVKGKPEEFGISKSALDVSDGAQA